MSSVVPMFNNGEKYLPEWIVPAFYNEAITSEVNCKLCSSNELSITGLDARQNINSSNKISMLHVAYELYFKGDIQTLMYSNN